jgi:hypothetical protein
MKFLKQKNISKFSVSDNTLFSNQYGRSIMDLTGGIRLPKGTTAQRPQVSGVRTPNGADGFIRYNTDLNSIEAYIAGLWTTVRASDVATVRKQTLGPGDDVETVFGPLDEVPTAPSGSPFDYAILVLVENVIQISTTNYTILYDYVVPGDAYIQFTSPVPNTKNVTIYYGFGN